MDCTSICEDTTPHAFTQTESANSLSTVNETAPIVAVILRSLVPENEPPLQAYKAKDVHEPYVIVPYAAKLANMVIGVDELPSQM